jgi:regulator of protease activity HflC (stomatin/prohibitin superfamily)
MFSIKRIIIFWVEVLRVAFPFILVAFGFGLLTEVLTHLDAMPDQLSRPEFWLAVVVDMLPAVFVSGVVFWLAARFVSAVYGLDSAREGLRFLIRHRFGRATFGPFLKIAEGRIVGNTDGALTRIGGPGNLVIEYNSAVVLEQGGRLTRVAGPGFQSLEAFEKVYGVIDLQPKRYRPYTVTGMTCEGIPVNWDVEVHYQIADGDQKPTPTVPYPLSEDDVLQAATSNWRRQADLLHGQDMDWEELIVVSQAERALRTILAQHSLDELIGLTEAEEHTAREFIQEELKRVLCQTAPDIGAKILQVNLHNLKVEDAAVTQQWIRNWRTRWQSESQVHLVEKEAERIYHRETAKAEAEIWLIHNICRALQQLEDKPTVLPTVIMMRLFTALERAGFSAASRVFVPGEALKALEQMKQMVVGTAQSAEPLDGALEEVPGVTGTEPTLPTVA